MGWVMRHSRGRRGAKLDHDRALDFPIVGEIVVIIIIVIIVELVIEIVIIIIIEIVVVQVVVVEIIVVQVVAIHLSPDDGAPVKHSGVAKREQRRPRDDFG
jgi:hypothetical protein